MMYAIACAVSERVSGVLRHPFFVIAFPIVCALFVLAGWWTGQLQLFLLILTTVLSVLASWQASMVMLRQARDAGDLR